MSDVFVELPSGSIIRTDRPDLWKDGKRVSKAKGEAKLAAEARAFLLGVLKPGQTVYTILRHVSRSGMYRRISLQAISAERPGEMVWLDGACLNLGLGDRPRGRGDGVGVGGCGMDMGFHLVYSLSRALWPHGYGCIGQGCPSNDHFNGDRDYSVHVLRDEHGELEDREPGPGEAADGCKRHWHRDGGYMLRHKWL